MKRLILILTALVAFSAPVLVTGGTAMAADVFNNCGQGSAGGTPDVCSDANGQNGNNAKGNNNPIVDIIKSAIDILSYIIGAAAIIGLIVSGIRMMTASGDAQAVASARSGVIYSLIGIAVTVLAQALVAYVLAKIG